MKLFTGRKIKKLQRAVERYPHDPENHFRLAEALLAEGEPGEARQVLARMAPGDAELDRRIRLFQARLFLAEGRPGEAREGLEGFPPGPEVDPLFARMVAGSLPERTPDAEELSRAEEILRKEAAAGGESAREAWRLLAELGAHREDRAAELAAWSGWLGAAGSESGSREETARILLRIGELQEQDSPDDAIKHYLRSVETRPEDEGLTAEAYLRLARLRRADEDLLGAAEKLEMALRYLGRGREIQAAEAMLELAEVYGASGRDAQARAEMERASRLPDLPGSLRGRIEAWRARDLAGQDRVPEALELARRVVQEEDGESPGDGRLLLGEILLAADQPQEAVETLQGALEGAPGAREARIRLPLARALLNLGRPEEAMEHAQAALDLAEGDQTAPILLVLAESRLGCGRLRDGVRALLRVVEENPGTRLGDQGMDRIGRLRVELEDPARVEALDCDPAERAEVAAMLAESDEADVVRRLRRGLSRTQASLSGGIERLLTGRTEIDEDLLEELEAVLIQADLGVETTTGVIEAIRGGVQRKELREPERIKEHIKEHIRRTLEENSGELDISSPRPYVILMVGVNGVGKTTTIAKLAKRFRDEGAQVLLAAGDTFRAAATEQLMEWGKRVGVEVIHGQPGADPSSVAFDAVQAAAGREVDVLIVDTAGRLHTKVNLMEELKKIRRVIDRKLPGAPHEVLLVLDGTTGQNAISQAKTFSEAVAVTGLVLTKLDGTAKGGIVVRITQEFGIPVKFIGIGEKMEDLREFVAADFVEAIFG